MARYLGPLMRKCRRLGVCLTPKAERFFSKAGRDLAGSGFRRGKRSAYGQAMLEKQKVKLYYGVLERQFRRYFAQAEREKGNTGENLMRILERRLDNCVFRAGWARSRAEARQFIAHGHIKVDGKKVNISSYLVQVGQTLSVREKEKSLRKAAECFSLARSEPCPTWIALDCEPEKNQFRAKIEKLPTREEVNIPVQEQLIVELLSK